MALHHENIGGGKVKQSFRMGDRFLPAGTALTAKEILAMPYANRVALIGRFIEVWPEGANGVAKLKASPGESKRYVMHLGGGRWNVIEGRKLSAKPLTKEQAEALAAAG